MNGSCYIVFMLTLLIHAGSFAQAQHYTVRMAPFSTRIYDEFSPVFYRNGIAFCSNQSNKSLVGYRDDNSRLFKIFYVPGKDGTGWKQSRIFAKEIASDFNDGPVTFSNNGNFMYFSRNNVIEKPFKNISDTTNKLGIYSAEFIHDTWVNIRPFTYNNPLYNFSTPALTPDGSRIYFSSDMSGGSGGMDLYYCDRYDDTWGKPVNLGTRINTAKNETFPFACRFGRLYFASDGFEGYGGKDLYYTQEIDGAWIAPVHLDSAINSPADDFGIVLDSTLENGYFSSNRRKTDDIFIFNSTAVKFAACDEIRENNYCYTLYDEHYQLVDTMPVTYQWDVGDGMKYYGPEVKHCFPGAGDYSVHLSIYDDATGEPVADQIEYNVHLENIDQAYINSYDVGIVDKPVTFDGLQTNLNDFSITSYLWDFGDSFAPGGSVMSKTFGRKGEYLIQMGLLGKNDSLGTVLKTCVRKTIRIYDTYQEWILTNGDQLDETAKSTDNIENKQLSVQIRIYIMGDLSEKYGAKIKEALSRISKPVIEFDQYGILPASYPVLDNVSLVLKENPDIRLELSIHALEETTPGNSFKTAENWAQELAFYLKNKETEIHAYHCKGFGKLQPLLNPMLPEGEDTKGVLELIFLKR